MDPTDFLTHAGGRIRRCGVEGSSYPGCGKPIYAGSPIMRGRLLKDGATLKLDPHGSSWHITCHITDMENWFIAHSVGDPPTFDFGDQG